MLIDFRLYLSSKDAQILSKCGKEFCILFIGAVIIHLSFVIPSLEMQADVIECSIGIGFGLRMIVAPKFASGIHHGDGFG